MCHMLPVRKTCQSFCLWWNMITFKHIEIWYSRKGKPVTCWKLKSCFPRKRSGKAESLLLQLSIFTKSCWKAGMSHNIAELILRLFLTLIQVTWICMLFRLSIVSTSKFEINKSKICDTCAFAAESLWPIVPLLMIYFFFKPLGLGQILTISWPVSFPDIGHGIEAMGFQIGKQKDLCLSKNTQTQWDANSLAPNFETFDKITIETSWKKQGQIAMCLGTLSFSFFRASCYSSSLLEATSMYTWSRRVIMHTLEVNIVAILKLVSQF